MTENPSLALKLPTPETNILTSEEIDTEVNFRISALQSATKEEIVLALNQARQGSNAEAFLQAFSEKEKPILSREEVEEIARTQPRTLSTVQRGNLNKTGVFPNNSLYIKAEKHTSGTGVIAWTVQNTRIQVSKEKKIPRHVIELHENATLQTTKLEAKEANLFNCLIGQYLGLPLNHLASFCEIDAEETGEIIERINLKHLKNTGVLIHLRNGVAILEETGKHKRITIVDNEETRKNLFPKKPDKFTADLTTAIARAQSAEDEAAGLRTTNFSLQEQMAKLETDVQEALTLAADTQTLAEERDRLRVENAGLLKKLAEQTGSLRSARVDTESARSENRRLNQRLTAARRAAEEAEEFRAILKRFQGRNMHMDLTQLEIDFRNAQDGLKRAETEVVHLKRQLATERYKTAINPQELAGLKEAATKLEETRHELTTMQTRLEEKNKKIAKLEKEDRQQQESPETELGAKSTEIEQLKAEISSLREKIEKLTREVGESNDLLTQLTDPDTAQATKTAAPAVAHATTTTHATATTPAPATTPATNPKPTQPDPKKPNPPEMEDPIITIKKTGNPTSQSLVTEVKKALVFHGGGKDGLPKTKLRELRDALTALSNLEDWTKTVRNTIVQMLRALKEGTTGRHIPVAEVQKCMDELAKLAA